MEGSLHIKEAIQARQAEVAEFCKRWRVSELALFGSVLRDDFRPESDVDVLVTLDEKARHTLFDLHQMEEDLRLISWAQCRSGQSARHREKPQSKPPKSDTGVSTGHL